MFVGVTAVQSAFTFGDLLDWLLPLVMIWGGFVLIKKNKNKAIKTVGILLAAAGIFLLVWIIAWQLIARIII